MEPPTFQEAFRFWSKLGWISFGGPAGQIAIMHRELVERKRWISEDHFLHAVNFCMLLPGPEAQQLAIYLGWRLHGMRGGIAAGTLFVFPAACILFGLSWLYVAGGSLPWLAGAFHGLLGAVIAVVLEAVLRIGRRALQSASLIGVAALAFVLIFCFRVSFVWILLGAALLGAVGHGSAPRQFPSAKSHGSGQGRGDAAELSVVQLPPVSNRSAWGSVRLIVICLALWWLPVLAVSLWLGWGSIQAQQGLFFSKAALVTFGGAYAVLPYVAQQAVETYGWLTHSQMMAGLALAETTPGPLIMVLQFVGFVGAWQQPGALAPLASASLGAAITTWVTFLPCFLFVFLGAPHVERLGELPRLSASLMAITAAVVGVILNLAVKFGQQALWPEGSFDPFVLVLTVASFLALHRFKVDLTLVIGACALAGALWSFR
jgi:chromate transporter